MLIRDLRQIGNRLYAIRKQYGMTQLEVAAAADVSDRTYADIERGTVNMRLDTLLTICDALHITPDEILTTDNEHLITREEDLLSRLDSCSPKDKETALRLLDTYLRSLPDN